MKLGSYIAVCRGRHNLTQEKLAEKIGVSKQAVSHWEGHKMNPSVRNLVRLADFFGIDPEEMMNKRLAKE